MDTLFPARLQELYERGKSIPHVAWITVRDSKPYINYRTSDLDRIDKTFSAVCAVYEEAVANDLPPNADYFLFADDVPPTNLKPMLAYCGTPDSQHYVISLSTLFPSLDEWSAKWMAHSEKPFESRKDVLWWIGGYNPKRNPVYQIRQKIAGTEMYFTPFEHAYVPMHEQTDYKYIMDIEGIGWSMRLVWLFHMGCVVFVLDRDLHDFWFRDNFVPWVDYVPVKRDASDLEDALARVKSMPCKGKTIAESGRAKARRVLTDSYMKEHLVATLRAIHRAYGACLAGV